jgi:glycosyltransferase involved in cell wall biosynthesis
VRSVDAQVEGLEARYERLLHDPTDHQQRWRPDRVLFVVGLDGAPTRYRAHLPAEALALHGVATDVRHYRDPDVEQVAATVDVVVVYRVPATPQVLALIARERARGAIVVFDVDDLIFDPDIAAEIPALTLLPPAEARLWLEGVHRYRTTMEACDAYIGPTPRLVDHAREVVGIESHLVGNGVGRAVGAASDIALRRPRRAGPLRVGYFSGTTTHDDDWRYIEETVVSVLETHPETELWLGGHLEPTRDVLARLVERVHRLPFTPWPDLPAVLRDVDVNLAPLAPGSRFNDAKSAIKWLEAALVSTPTIASPSAPFVDAIGDGRGGWLATDPREWAAALDEALRDADKRVLTGTRARRDALLRWSPHLQGARYLDALEAIRQSVRHGRRSPSPSWLPVSNDEPLLATRTPLEPYPPELSGSVRWRRRPRVRTPVRAIIRQKAGRLRSTLADEGVGATLRGGGRVAGRVVARTAALPGRVLGRRRSPRA